MPDLFWDDREITRWYTRAPFNPGSTRQVAAAAALKGHILKKGHKTQGLSTDRTALEGLIKDTGDEFYGGILARRDLNGLLKTYVGWPPRPGLGMLGRMGSDQRIHATFNHRPSNLRLSCVNPNLQNIVADEDDPLCMEFRSCFKAAPGCVLIDPDLSAIEAIETGWFSKDPNYVKLSSYGIHSFVAATKLGISWKPSWSPADLRALAKEIKIRHGAVRKSCKVGVHLTNYGGSPRMMVLAEPGVFSTVKAAQEIQELYFEVCPALRPWHHDLRQFAHRMHYLGGPGTYPFGHPFGVKHWFWGVYDYRRIDKGQYARALREKKEVAIFKGRHYKVTLGEDSKKVIAFFPASTTRCVVTEAEYKLFVAAEGSKHYIGDAGDEMGWPTPLRADVHDSNLLEVPAKHETKVVEALRGALTSPILQQPCPPAWGLGEHLTPGCSIKVGLNWGEMREVA